MSYHHNQRQQQQQQQRSKPSQYSEVELLMGADAPYYPGTRSLERNVNFLTRFLKAMNTEDHPNSDVLHASIWKAYAMMNLFQDLEVKKSLVTLPSADIVDSSALSPQHGDLPEELKKKELAHLAGLQKELMENTYSSEKLLDNCQTFKGASSFFFESRLKKLKILADEAEPYASEEKIWKSQLRKLKADNTQLFYPPEESGRKRSAKEGSGQSESEAAENSSVPPPSPESPAPPVSILITQEQKDEILGQAANLEGKIKASQELKKSHSPAGKHFTYYENLVNGLYASFGDYAALGEDFRKGQVQQGKYSAYLGEAMETIALSAGPNGGLDQILEIVYNTERVTRATKYNHTLWHQFGIGSSGWFKCCQTLTFPGVSSISPAENEDGSLNPEAIAAFQEECRKNRLPHLVLVDGLQYRTSLGLAGEFDGVVLDILLEEEHGEGVTGGGGGKSQQKKTPTPEILMLIEVKANPPDLVYARAQRERVSNAVSQVLNPPAVLPEYQQQILDSKQKKTATGEDDEGKAEKKKPKGPPSFSFKSAKAFGQNNLPLPQLQMHSLSTFCADPVRRWIFVSSANPPPEKGPVYAPFIHVLERELVGPLALALDNIILSPPTPMMGTSSSLKLFSPAELKQKVLQSGSDPMVRQLRLDLVNNYLLEEERLKEVILPSIDLKHAIDSLFYQWKKAQESNPALDSPKTFLHDLRSRGCEDHLVLVQLKEGALRKPKEQLQKE